MNCAKCNTALQCPKCLQREREQRGRAQSTNKLGRPSKHGHLLASVQRLREEGKSFTEIEQLTGVPKSTAHRIMGRS